MGNGSDGQREANQLAGAAKQASDKGDWSQALLMWEECLKKYPIDRDLSKWRQSHASVLNKLGRHTDAEDAYRSIAVDYPNLAGGLVGLAQVAQAQGKWALACDHWNECLTRFPTHSNVFAWRNFLGIALFESGRMAEAEKILEALEVEQPGAPKVGLSLARLKERQHRWADALMQWDTLIERSGNQVQSNWFIRRASVLMELGRFDEAEQALLGCVEREDTQMAGLGSLAQVAMRRKLWPEAFEWWEIAREKVRGLLKPNDAALRAVTVAELGKPEEAREILIGLMSSEIPDNSLSIRLASVLVKNKDLDDALKIVNSVLEREPNEAKRRNAAAIRARALFELGKFDDAELTYRDLSRNEPRHLGGLCLVLSSMGRHSEVLELLGAASQPSVDAPDLIAPRVRSMIALGQISEARSIFNLALQRLDSPLMLNCLMELAASLFEEPVRTQKWLALLEKGEQLEARRAWAPNPSIVTIRLRLFLALRRYDDFLSALDRVRFRRTLGRHETNIGSAARAIRKKPFPAFDQSKIFGIGLSKTGTTSLASALKALGYATVDWSNRQTGELMSDDDFYLYEAFTDAPACVDFETQFHRFPNSRFIYTTRPPLDWERSYASHLKRFYLVSSFEEAKRRMTNKNAVHYGARYVEIYSSLYFNYKGYAEAYEAYDRRVRSFFADKPPTRFLDFNLFAGDSWTELCSFLGRDIPSISFPWENRAPRLPPTGANAD